MLLGPRQFLFILSVRVEGSGNLGSSGLRCSGCFKVRANSSLLFILCVLALEPSMVTGSIP